MEEILQVKIVCSLEMVIRVSYLTKHVVTDLAAHLYLQMIDQCVQRARIHLWMVTELVQRTVMSRGYFDAVSLA
jgi:hypothetical protein